MERIYRINNHDLADPYRKVATNPQLEADLVENGYAVRERLFSLEEVAALRQAVDELAEAAGGVGSVGTDVTFGGLFVRSAIEKHPLFWQVANDPRLLDLARTMLGPQVQIHGNVLRITYPGQPNQETHWHFHQRVVPDPIPPFFAYPRVLDNLIYLDDLDDETGPFCVLPGTHKDITKELPAGIKTDLPGQVKVIVPAGSCVTADAAVWHRGMATTEKGRVRRLLIIGYSPTWMKPIDFPSPEFIARHPEPESRELLGLAGHY
ncbi:MAG: phytanoyl-CoA dioxygenase family protein [Fimbriimonas sp.]